MEKSERLWEPIHDGTMLERAITPLAFKELSELAEELCLSQPLKRPVAPEKVSTEAAVVRKFGAHGLRLALEMEIHGEHVSVYPFKKDEADYFLQHLEDQTHGPYPEAEVWAEAFGEALLDEAYKTLGDDADEKIEAYRQAETVQDQASIIDWLNDRLKEMSSFGQEETPQSIDDAMIYHPIRLSPKAIGRWPDLNIAPTCLGISIVAASFMKKAGAPTLHAGVMTSALEHKHTYIMSEAFRAHKQIKEIIPEGSKLDRNLMSRWLALRAQLIIDNGYHAVALAKLMDGSWCQIDPNYDATAFCYQPFGQSIDQAYAAMHEFAETAPALEVGVVSQTADALVVFSHYGRDIDTKRLLSYRTLVADILMNSNSDAVMKQLNDTVAEIFLKETSNVDGECHQDNKEPYEEVMARLFTPQKEFAEIDLDKAAELSEESELSIAEPIIENILKSYVLYGDDVKGFVRRCQTDENYLLRRVDDVLAAVCALKFQLMHEIPESDCHFSLELGRPESRIGLAVLSDIASYIPNSLPATFWLSTWPSLIPITERAQDGGTCGGPGVYQSAVMMKTSMLKRNWGLNYLRQYGRVSCELSADNMEGGDSNGEAD